MRVNIVGYGLVGRAQKHLCSYLGHRTYIYDPYKFPSVKKPSSTVDLSFVCTPEGSVEDAVKTLTNNKTEGLYVIKSTVPPRTTERLMKKYDVHICHNPEFLRTKHALSDVLNPSRILIGECCSEHGGHLKRFYSRLNSPIYIASPTETEIVKLLTNALRATVISFWNGADLLCRKCGVETSSVASLLDQVKTIGSYEGGNWGTKFFGLPYGGRCLPKDVRQLIETFRCNGLKPTLFEAVEEFNRMLKDKTLLGDETEVSG